MLKVQFRLTICGVIFMTGYITVQEAAEKWGISSRQVQILCKEKRIEGVSRMSRIWIIPAGAKKPTSNRKSIGSTNAKS